MKIYLIGSMRNPSVAELAQDLRALGFEVFDDWLSSGPEADDHWQRYEQARGRSFVEALDGAHARDVFEFDKRHLDAASVVILVMPSGRSAHLELGYSLGKGKRGFIYLSDGEPDRWDVMYGFADRVFTDREELLEAVRCLKP